MTPNGVFSLSTDLGYVVLLRDALVCSFDKITLKRFRKGGSKLLHQHLFVFRIDT